MRKRGELTGADGQRRRVTVLWSVQVDAAAGVEAVHEVDGDGARVQEEL